LALSTLILKGAAKSARGRLQATPLAKDNPRIAHDRELRRSEAEEKHFYNLELNSSGSIALTMAALWRPTKGAFA
jgi:hypothetical protein